MRRNKIIILFLACLVGSTFLVGACGGGGGGGGSAPLSPIMLASVDSAGTEGNTHSYESDISSDGRYVAFFSNADNLVGSDTNGFDDVFVHDTETGITSRVSVSTAGSEANISCYKPSINSDGSYVAFYSLADNLVVNDGNNAADIFLRDTTTNTTSRVSVNTAGTEGSSDSYDPSISSDGRYVAFLSMATNLVANDVNNATDIFVRDRTTPMTSRVSVSTAGSEANGASESPSISSDGQYVVFLSSASNLVINDTNVIRDVFVRDLTAMTTKRVNVSTAGTEANNISWIGGISSDGRYVAFYSLASTLVANDTNGFRDVFVRDTVSNITSRVSVGVAGTQSNENSYTPAISSNGRHVTLY